MNHALIPIGNEWVGLLIFVGVPLFIVIVGAIIFRMLDRRKDDK